MLLRLISRCKNTELIAIALKWVLFSNVGLFLTFLFYPGNIQNEKVKTVPFIFCLTMDITLNYTFILPLVEIQTE